MRSLTFIIMSLLIVSCGDDGISKADFLIGPWKMENAEQYEVWEMAGDDSLTGYSYILENDQRNITETLSITIIQGVLTYNATVANQNSGNTISFELNERVENYLSFENLDHDFPKKIQYKYISPDSVQVTVLGENDEGFTYVMMKQK